MTVKRYDAHTNIDDFKSDWHESTDGAMVKHDDYAALLKERDALTAENAGLKKFSERLSEMHSNLNGTGTGIQGCQEAHIQQVAIEAVIEAFDELETPSTDAAIAEIKARGVDEYADSLDSGADDAERDGFDDAVKFLRSEASGVRLFAAQLRKESCHDGD